jgi:hypothetical protein
VAAAREGADQDLGLRRRLLLKRGVIEKIITMRAQIRTPSAEMTTIGIRLVFGSATMGAASDDDLPYEDQGDQADYLVPDRWRRVQILGDQTAAEVDCEAYGQQVDRVQKHEARELGQLIGKGGALQTEA